MARRPSKHTRPFRELRIPSSTRVDSADSSWVVRTVSGAAAVKDYTCPGCHRPIPAGSAHLVVWPTEAGIGADLGVAARRHWHRSCWDRRSAR